jgi:hypothetical protein
MPLPSVGSVDARPGAPSTRPSGRRGAPRPASRSYRQACLAHNLVGLDQPPTSPALAVERTDRRAIVPWSLDILERRGGAPHCAGVHERSCMEGDRAVERWLVPRSPARARWRSPHVRRTKGSALIEVLMTARNVLVASRPPSGTTVRRQPATPRRQRQHPRSRAPRQSPPRIVYNSPAVLLETGLAIVKLPACISSSQPPLLECCDDRLNPPSTPRPLD